ncbi:MAG: hypothetical protein V2I57_08030 [Xanthomonadales bacterium]|jgi:FkbM family methyltransferase|nr:hypothetical protein [Xanthomonadales bacterium]
MSALKKQLARFAPWLPARMRQARLWWGDSRRDASMDYELDGIVLPGDERLISPVLHRALSQGRYEGEERTHLPGLLQDGDVVLELGAGLGVVSTLCARDERVRKVVTVEANPDLIPYVQEVHRRNGVTDKVSLMHAVALPAPDVDEVDFFVRKDIWASSLNGKIWGWDRKVSTKVVDLHTLVEDLDPTLMIVDIEGGEVQLLKDFSPGNLRHVYVEIHKQVIGPRGVRFVFNQLARAGFAYDPAFSARGVVTFTRIPEPPGAG